MRRPVKALLLTFAVYAVYAVIVWLLGGALGLAGLNLWVFRGGFLLLGVAAAVLLGWFLYQRVRASASAAAADEIDTAFGHAAQRLAAARAQGVRALSDLPLVLVLGPEGSAKTSTIMHSGLEPDLLAGETARGQAVAPTTNVNLWYARGVLIVEPGGKLLGDPRRWSHLIQRLRPKRLVAVLAGRPQPPRAAVVCFSCEDLVQGNQEVVVGAARALRERLAAVSRALGIRLPVYVVFTKADRVRAFPEFVGQLAGEEARQGLGATLRITPPIAAGAYADREHQRVSGAFEAVLGSLAGQRLRILPRIGDAAERATAYEFPREVRKLEALAVQFLVELCRPRQLEVSPFLRGFYLAGVRALTVDAAPAAAPPASDTGPVRATQVLTAEERAALARQADAPRGPVRRVPQWLFLTGLFHEVIQRDRVALGLTQSGHGLRQLRRLAFASLAGVGLLFALGFTVSFISNRVLESRVLGAAEAVKRMAPSEPLPLALRALDDLRAQLETLGGYAEGHPPLHLRWGLYSGSALLPPARTVFWSGFQAFLLNGIRDSVRRELVAMTANPEGVAVDSANGRVAAYLMTTSRPDQLTPDAAEALLRRSPVAPRLEGDDRAIAVRLLRFYGDGLCAGGTSCAIELDGMLAGRACTMLTGFSDADQVYLSLLGRAAQGHQPIRFTSPVIRLSAEVPAAFTADGWRTVHEAFAKGELSAPGQNWIYETIGCQSAARRDVGELTRTLRARYDSAYIAAWSDFLRAAQVSLGSGVGGAATSISALAGPRSPLLQVLALVAANTDVDSVVLGRAFQPVLAVMPSPAGERLIVDANRDYVTQLDGLARALQRLSSGADPGARDAALAQAQSARQAAAQLVSTFSAGEEAADVGSSVRRLLEDPVAHVEGLLQRLPQQQLAAAIRSFCGDFNSLMAQYPFNAGGPVAQLRDVTRIFQPRDGDLARLNSDVLGGALVRRGTEYALNAPNSAISRAFVDFYNRAMRVSDTWFDAQGQGPRFGFTVRLSPPPNTRGVKLVIDGHPMTRTQSNATQSEVFQWVAEQARGASLAVTVGGRDVEILGYPEQWGVFRLFGRARWEARSRGEFRVVWSIEREGTTYDVEGSVTPVGEPLLQPGYFSRLRCPQ
jgi:type VI secretion system protein ImpL